MLQKHGLPPSRLRGFPCPFGKGKGSSIECKGKVSTTPLVDCLPASVSMPALRSSSTAWPAPALRVCSCTGLCHFDMLCLCAAHRLRNVTQSCPRMRRRRKRAWRLWFWRPWPHSLKPPPVQRHHQPPKRQHQRCQRARWLLPRHTIWQGEPHSTLMPPGAHFDWVLGSQRTLVQRCWGYAVFPCFSCGPLTLCNPACHLSVPAAV